MILPRAYGSLTRRREPLQIFTSAATSGASSQFGGSRTARRVLAEARAWCDEARGRQSKLAAYLGVSRQAISAWFREAERKHPRKRPTGRASSRPRRIFAGATRAPKCAAGKTAITVARCGLSWPQSLALLQSRCNPCCSPTGRHIGRTISSSRRGEGDPRILILAAQCVSEVERSAPAHG